MPGGRMRWDLAASRDAVARGGTNIGPSSDRMDIEQRKLIKRLAHDAGVDVGELEGVSYTEALDLIGWLDRQARAGRDYPDFPTG